uniref:EAL domain-containing protein n=1 Tax=Klebsiella pneumoniae TaxID=573 RepID=A0A410J3M8_KLEPN|nr:hypothetical protein [Klebsiella pneumoniae]
MQSASDVQCSRLLKTTMEVVAEGVETPDCLAWLRQAGCDTVQGFLFARPMPAAAFVGFVNQWRNTTMNANERAPVAACAARKSRSMPPSRRKGPSTWSISAGWSAISASRRGPALRPKPASNRTLVIRRRQVEAYPNLMSGRAAPLRQNRVCFPIF